MDEENFNSEKLEEYFTEAVDCIYELYLNKLDFSAKRNDEENLGSNEVVDNVFRDDDDAEIIDEHNKLLYEQVRDEEISANNEDDVRNAESMKADLKQKIENTMKQYREYCSSMNMIGWLDEYGNEKYQEEKKINRTLY
jgi:hypothetical protein